MFIKILNLPPGNCVRGVKHVYTGSEPTSRHKRKNTHACIMAWNSRGLFARGTASLYSFFFLPPGNCPLRCSLFLRFLNLPAGAACFLRFLNLPSGDYWPGLRPVYMVLEPTLRDLPYEG